jgi:hypothetical protein
LIPATATLLALTSLSGCALRETSGKAAALVQDNEEVSALEEDLEGSLEEPLTSVSGSDGSLEIATAEDAAATSSMNAGVWFHPEGCLKSELEGRVVTHTFDDCTGPRGRRLSGVVTSTWSLGSDSVSVRHETDDFSINGATLDHEAVVELRHEDGKLVRNRSGSTVGETAEGNAIEHTASFVIVHEVNRGCAVRDGHAELTIGEHQWSRTVEGYEVCGDLFTCPSAGTITMSGPRAEGKIEITASGVYDLTVGDRTDTDREMLWCNPE